MRNIRITLAYEGTAYSGFQRQENSITVQEILETALQKTDRNKNHALLRRAHGCRRSCLRAGMHLLYGIFYSRRSFHIRSEHSPPSRYPCNGKQRSAL